MGLIFKSFIRTILFICLVIFGTVISPFSLGAQQAPTDITIPDGLNFPGDINSSILIPDAPEIQGSGDFSVEIQVDFGIVEDDEYLFSTTGDWLNEGLTLKTYSQGLELIIGDGDGTPEYLDSAPAILSNDTVHHVALVKQGDDFNLYLDANPVASTTNANFNPAAADWEIGKNLSGTITDFRFWTIARTQQELADNINSTLSGGEANLEIYYDFLQNAGTTITDLTGNGHNGTFQGALSEASWVADGATLMVAENAPNGTIVGMVEGVEADGDILTYSLLDSAGGCFDVNSLTGEISVANGSLLNFETDSSHVITVHITDTVDGDYQEDITIQVIDINDATVITSDGGGESAAIDVPENTTLVTTVTATDEDGDQIEYTISGGADAAMFDIDGNTGVLTFLSAPNFESPADANADNIYELQVSADDQHNGIDSQDLSLIMTRTAGIGAAVWSDTSSTPQTSDWDGSIFGATGNTTSLADRYRTMQGAEAPTRDEKIVVGIDAGGNTAMLMWDGSSWSSIALTGTVSETYWYGAEVAYEQVSGDAVVVWNDNSQAAGDMLRYAVWDGSNWSTPQSIAAYVGAEPQNLRLAFDPGSDAMVLVVSDVVADDYALVWDGDTWGNAIALDKSGTVESDQSAIAVAFEAQSGEAMVTYGKNGDANVYYRMWDGSSWTAEADVTPAAGITGEVAWLSSASDYTSDRIVLGVTTNSGEAWLSVWNGSAWETSELAETGITGTIYPNLAVAFEGTTGQALITYGEGTETAFRYRTWNTATGWSEEQTGPDIGGVPNSMTLDPGPTSDHIMLTVQDDANDLHLLHWNGGAWGTDNELSTNTGEVKNQPFVFIYDQDGMLVDPDQAPVNTVPETQTTAVDTPLIFNAANGNAISVADTDSPCVEISLTATNGSLTLSQVTGLSFTLGDGSSGTNLVFSGTVADVNAALDGLQFDPMAGFEGFAGIEIFTSDFCGGGTKTDADSISIEVGTVNSAPVNSVPADQLIDMNGMLLFSSANGNAISTSDSDAGSAAIQVTLTATNGTLNLSGIQGLLFSEGDGSADDTMIFTGSIADINAALEGMTFTAAADFTGAASVQIITDDLGHTGAGGPQSDTDSVTITIQAPDQQLWLTFENDEGGTGSGEIPSITGGDVVTFGTITQLEASDTDPLAATTAGTLAYGFNLDTVLLSDGVTPASDGDTKVNAVHYVTRDIQVGTNTVQLRAGDLLLSTDGDEDIDGVRYHNDDVFVFRPDTFGDYSQGGFFLLIDGNAVTLNFNNISSICLVEASTSVNGAVTLNAGEFLVAHDGSGKNILRYVPGNLGGTTTGSASILIAGADIDIGQNIGGVHLVQADTVIGGVSLTAGQLLVSVQGNDSTIGDAPTIDVLRQDIFILDVTAIGSGTSAATAHRFFEGLDEGLDNNNETIWGVGYQGNAAPLVSSATFYIDENSANGTAVGSVSATDPENSALYYSITAGNTDDAFAIASSSGDITVANGEALDFETIPVFMLTIAAIDNHGAYDTATITVNLNNLDEAGVNDAPENTVPVAQGIDRNGMLLFSSANGNAISTSDSDAGSAAIQVTLTATNGTLNLSGIQGLLFSEGDGSADDTMIFTGSIADINAALEGMTFTAAADFTGAASVQIITDDLGHTGAGGPQSDTDSVTITIQAPDQQLWLTFENDEGGTGSGEIPSITGGDVVTFGTITQLEASDTDPLAATTAGTLAYGFNLDTVLLSDGVTPASDGDTKVNAVHYVTRDIQVGTNTVQLRAGDLLLSTDGDEDIDGVRYHNDDVFVFRPDTFGDYSQGGFFLLIDGNAVTLNFNNISSICLVEASTSVNGAVTLNAGEFLVAHDGSGKNILRYVPGNLGGTTTGSASILIAGADIDIGQNIGGVHLVQADTVIGGVSLTAGQLLVSVQGNDSTIGDAPTIDVLRQDIFILDVTAIGSGTSAATAHRFFEGLDEGLDNNNETIWGVGYQGNAAPLVSSATFYIDENSANGTAVGSVSATDPENSALYYSITAENTGGAFAIDATTGQITVANSEALDYGTIPSFTLTVAAIDTEGAYGTATITINLNDINDAPVLDSTGAMTLTGITEDETANTGDTVAEIIASPGGDRITDPDAGAVEGIAVTGMNSSNGTWQYSINGGGTWLDVGTVSDSSALLLRNTDSLRFVPDAQNADTASVTFRAWDQTEGSAGDKVDASANGGAAAFSVATESAAITVAAVNDAPSLSTSSPFPGIVEDDFANNGMRVSTYAGLANDPDIGDSAGIAVTATDETHGHWQYALDGTTWADVGSVAVSNALLLAGDATSRFRFVPNADYSGGSGILNYKAWDQTAGVAGTYVDATDSGGTTAFSFGTNGAAVSVSPVNDAPVLLSGSISNLTVNEDAGLTSLGLASVTYGPGGGTDESGQALGYQVTVIPDPVSFGKIYLSDGTTQAATGSYSLADIQGMQFVPNPDESGTSFFAFNVQDDGGTANGGADSLAQSIQITVTGTSDAPSFTSVPITVATEDSLYSYSITASDPDSGDSLNISGTVVPSWLTLTDNGDGTGSLEGTPTNGEVGDHGIQLHVSDGTLSATQIFTLTVANTNDPPGITSNGGGDTAGISIPENTIAVTDVDANDPDTGATFTYSLSGGLDQARFAIDADSGVLSFLSAPDYEIPTDDSGENDYEVTVQVSDGDLTDTQTLTVTVTNELPVITADQEFTIDESDPAGTLVGTVLTTGDPTTSFSITAGDSGDFRIEGSGNIYVEDDANLDHETQPQYALTIQVNDGPGGTIPVTGTVTVNVGDVNEPPVLDPIGDQNIDELSELTFTATASDVDLPGGTLTFSLVGEPAGASIASDTGVFTWTPSEAQGPNSYTFDVVVTDNSTGLLSDSETITVTVNEDDLVLPVITLTGAEPQVIEVGDSYVELGATASDNTDGDITADIVIEAAAVNTAVVGSYSVTYDVSDASGNAAFQVTRTISVVDTTPPVVTLSGANPQIIEVGTAYSELGATALDNYDGDISGSIIINAAAVDTSTVGSYTVTYDVTDSEGNDAIQAVRNVNVVDTTIPVITLSGANPQSIEVGTAYSELGATASDNYDGDISGSIIIDASGVNTAAVGSYAVTYDVTDASGNAAVQVIRTVNVVDTTVPVITITGANPQSIEVGMAYSELGATASDNYDGDISGSIVIDASAVNTAVVGSYSVTYNVTDTNGNAAIQVIRTVEVVDTTAPVITLLGSDPVTVEVGSAYTDAGATATDIGDGDLTGSIVTVNLVDPNTVGVYTVTYDVTDSHGNPAAQVTRTVNVVDTTAPVITLTGAHPQNIEAGTAYTELGATASDNYDGDITGSIVIDAAAVNTSVVGSYSVTYDVTDASGNAAVQVIRTVNIVDTAAPVISLVGSNPVTIEVGSPYIDTGATATDTGDGNLTSSIITVNPVNIAVVGVYTVTYNVTDSQGNAAIEVTRTVNVVDTTAPVITLSGANPQIIEVGSAYSELGATASDNYDGDITGSVVIDAAAVNTAAVGSYSVTYNVTDSEGNDALQVTRTLNVVDTTAPVITRLGADPVTIEVGSTYIDAGATATDIGDGDLTGSIVTVNPVDPNIVGVYTVIYNVTDSSGNAAAEVNRTVNVVDTTAPVITRLGSDPVTIEVGSAYTDAGATATDIGDGDLTGSIITVNPVDPNTVGVYTVTYDVTDSQGNAAVQVTRTVNVVDTTAPVITLSGANPQTIEVGSVYSELGATASDNYDGDISGSIVVDASSVNTAVVGSYSVTYDVTDANGNAALQVTRTVNVVDTTAPVIVLLGSNPVTIEVGSPYTDAGATATDVGDGDLTSSITTVNPVNSAVIGTYTVTYNVTDLSGNAAFEVTRTVNVVDTTIPVITLTGAKSPDHRSGRRLQRAGRHGCRCFLR